MFSVVVSRILSGVLLKAHMVTLNVFFIEFIENAFDLPDTTFSRFSSLYIIGKRFE